MTKILIFPLLPIQTEMRLRFGYALSTVGRQARYKKRRRERRRFVPLRPFHVAAFALVMLLLVAAVALIRLHTPR